MRERGVEVRKLRKQAMSPPVELFKAVILIIFILILIYIIKCCTVLESTVIRIETNAMKERRVLVQ
jgi:hypothetical protein